MALGYVIEYAIWYYVAPYVGDTPIIQYNVFPRLCWLASAYVFLTDLVKYIRAQIFLSNRQVVYRRGIIKTQVDETALDEIKAAHVDQGVFGSLLNYGRIHLNCRYVSDIYLPAIRSPYLFVKALQDAQAASLSRDSQEGGHTNMLLNNGTHRG